jgi:hypothetical protein
LFPWKWVIAPLNLQQVLHLNESVSSPGLIGVLCLCYSGGGLRIIIIGRGGGGGETPILISSKPPRIHARSQRRGLCIGAALFNRRRNRAPPGGLGVRRIELERCDLCWLHGKRGIYDRPHLSQLPDVHQNGVRDVVCYDHRLLALLVPLLWVDGVVDRGELIAAKSQSM